MAESIRINKYLADKGIATRRGADILIAAGKVLINGRRADIGQKVQPGDTVTVEKEPRRAYRYVLYHKPRGIITHSPAKHEVDIRESIARAHGLKNLFPVGRLDKDSEGLILLTDDGRVTKRLLDPSYDHEKEYYVTVDKRVTGTFLRALSRGVPIEDYRTRPAHASPDPQSEFGFLITLTEGRKHQIRRMCAALGYQVTRLIRTRILSFSLASLTSGAYRTLSPREIAKLYKTLNLPL